MRDLPIENLDQESFETWQAHPGTEALISSMRMQRARGVQDLVNYAVPGGPIPPERIANIGGRIDILDHFLAIVLGETREKSDGK